MDEGNELKQLKSAFTTVIGLGVYSIGAHHLWEILNSVEWIPNAVSGIIGLCFFPLFFCCLAYALDSGNELGKSIRGKSLRDKNAMIPAFVVALYGIGTEQLGRDAAYAYHPIIGILFVISSLAILGLIANDISEERETLIYKSGYNDGFRDAFQVKEEKETNE